MLRTAPSMLLVGICSLAGVRRRRSLALAHERRLIRRATGALDLGAGLDADEEGSGPPLSTHVADPLGHEACSSTLVSSTALGRADVTLAAAPAVEPLPLLRAETVTRNTVEGDGLDPAWDTSAVVEIEANDGASRAILIQCDPLVDGLSFLAIADRAGGSSIAACARPPADTSPICEYVQPFESAPLSERTPLDGESATSEEDDATCLVALGPDDTLPLDFGDVVINSLRDD